MNIQLPDYKKSKVLVIGDVMLDCYWQGKAKKISPEAPVPVIAHDKVLQRAGGAANVAMNLAGLGVTCKLIGVAGEDANAEILTAILNEQGIDHQLLKTDLPTITKTRFMSQHQQLLRVDNEVTPMSSDALIATAKIESDGYDVVILSDYGKGALTDCQALLQWFKTQNKTVLVDPKGSDYSQYKGAYLITPNMAEFSLVAGTSQSDDELEEKAKSLIAELELSALLLTRSEAGMSLFTPSKHFYHPAKAKEVYDVTGAGDTVIATLAASLAAGSDIDVATELANLAAGIVVAKLGTATVSRRELDKAVHESRFIRQGFLDKELLLSELEKARAKGESIVMTNGCFDILHSGHVNYLEQAKKLGDRLLVAINTDESVARIKEPSRPANTLASRAHVLASLRAVDWVVAFSEDTPTTIIKDCAPDFLVKGGDNDPNTIPGAKEVRAQGGQVLVMDYIEGFSTTKTIERIKDR